MKYKLGEKHPELNLYRVVALKDFGTVKKGDVGGWIEGEQNLSQEGNCWVFDDALVFGDAEVYGNLSVCGNIRVGDNAVLRGVVVLTKD